MDPLRASDGAIHRLRALHPPLIDLTTGRIERLLDALGRPHERMGPVIHVAGTNGKGSTCAVLRAVAEAAGLKVHVLTSPHLVRFAERIRIAGRLVGDDDLSRGIDAAVAANAGQDISFFEIATALAFHLFAQNPADLCIIEVGLGGRFDASNVFAAPAVSVIAPVDYDHLELLGSDLGKIAWEKAGIIKRGRPVIVARQPDEALSVIESECEALHAPMTLMGRDIDGWEESGRLVVQLQDRLLDLPAPRLPGGHQFANAALAIAALCAWGDPRVDEAAMATGMETVVWPGRFQRLDRGPVAALAPDTDIWLDGAHNPHAAVALSETCRRLSARDGRPVALVVGMLGRKDAHAFFAALKDLGPYVFATHFDSAMATPADVLADAARASGLTVEVVDGVEAGVRRAAALPGPTPHIVICGSLHFVGGVLAMSPETWPD